MTGLALLLTACGKSQADSPSPAAASPTGAATAEVLASAEVGKAAPDFALKDLDGKVHKLSDYKGKTVVLEWYNPDC
ncbi:MAG TPA: redoxin domain-containing protein, partial [Myxococcota bacterium]|nr:redoxin domain-containing protein [Myxococcota bacterium]